MGNEVLAGVSLVVTLSLPHERPRDVAATLMGIPRPEARGGTSSCHGGARTGQSPRDRSRIAGSAWNEDCRPVRSQENPYAPTTRRKGRDRSRHSLHLG